MKYLSGGKRMREESLDHSLVPCPPLPDDSDEPLFRVESTGATVTLSSSVSLIYHYCSRLPSDEYFKPAPRFDVNKDQGSCTLYLPKSCPVKEVKAEANNKVLKQAVCLKACIQLHKVGALSDHLVPDMVVAETVSQKLEKIQYNTEQPCYFPPELVSQFSAQPETTYHFYLIRMKPNSPRNFHLNDVLLGTRVVLEDDIGNTSFRLEDHRGTIAVTLSYVGAFHLTQEEVLFCRRFQITLFRVLLDHSVENLMEALNGLHLRDGVALDYLLVPSTHSHETSLIDWEVIRSVNLTSHEVLEKHENCSTNGASRILHTKDGLFCTCVVQNALVYTPHNGYVYCTKGVLNNLNGNSLLTKRNSGDQTYIEYYEERHGIQLNFVDEPLLNGRHIFTLHSYLHMAKKKKEKEHDREFVELPPELCHVILSPISVDMIYSYTFIPSVMQRIESLLIAYNLKKSIPKVNIPTIKVLEAITTKKCEDQFHLESLETLGDSFLKYAVCQQLFQHCHTHHEGLLSTKKDGMISNVMLCQFGCQQKLQGFIRDECFEPKGWMVPGQSSAAYSLVNDTLPESRNIYVASRRNLKRKSVADVVESLIGAYLSEGGELAALMFMNWVGIKVDFTTTKIQRDSPIQAEKLVNVGYMESLLNYSFEDKSLLVEALTHGSYMMPEIPRCYQRLEFLGDSVLDYLITKHLYDKYPCLSPGLLTDMRSASVNNECYALVAVKANLHKHILYASHHLHKHISRTVSEFEQSSLQSTFGWESDISFPKVLGDVIESLAGAIFVDSGYNKEVVFASIKPLLGCMITPETVKLHPVRELTELCQKWQFELSKAKDFDSFTVEVKAKEMSFAHTAKASDKKMAKKLAYKEVLNLLKNSLDY
jgi:endoribonuclease Dicer